MTQISLRPDEKLLIHLYSYIRSADSWDMPEATTQEGIAKILGYTQSGVSKRIDKLVKDGLVIEKTAHVKGKPTKRKTYFLSSKGIDVIRKIKADIDQQEISVKYPDGKLKKIKFSELNSYLGTNVSPLTLINNISRGVLNYSKLLTVSERKEYVDFTDELLKIRRFFGRDKELAILQHWLGSKNQKIMVVHGIAGVGKTALCSKLISESKREMNVFYFRCHEWDTVKSVLDRVATFLSAIGNERLSVYLNTVGTVELREVSMILSEDLDGTNSLIVFDDIHTITDELNLFFTMFVETLETVTKVKVMFLGRKLPSFYDIRDVAVRNKIVELKLNGLDEKSSRQILSWRKIKVDDRKFGEVYKLLRGHPLFFELIGSVEKTTELLLREKSIEKFIRQEIYQKLTPSEKNLLSLASVYRHPVEPNALMCGAGNLNLVEKLVEQSLIEEISANLYSIHDILDDFIYRQLTDELKKKYHSYAAQYYENKAGEQFCIETIYHLLCADEFEHAAKLVVKNGSRLVNKGYLVTLRSFLEQFNETNLQVPLWTDILNIKGYVYHISGKFDLSNQMYRTALSLTDDKIKRAQFLMKIGVVQSKQGNYQMATKTFSAAKKLLGRTKNVVTGELLLNLGTHYVRQDMLDEAMHQFEKALDIFVQFGSSKSIANAHNNIGIIHGRKGQYKKALAHFQKSLEIRKQIDDELGILASYGNLGKVYFELGDLDRAMEFHNRELKRRQKIGHLDGLRISYSNIGDVYFMRGRYDDALAYYRKSLDIGRKLGARQWDCQIYSAMGDVYVEMGNYDKAFDFYRRSNEISRKAGEEFVLSCNYIGLAKLYCGKGHLKKAKNSCIRALKLATKLESVKTIGIAYRILGMIYRLETDYKSSIENFDRSVATLKRIGAQLELGRTYFEYGLMWSEKSDSGKDLSKAKECLDRALQLLKKCNVDREIANVRKALTELARKSSLFSA